MYSIATQGAWALGGLLAGAGTMISYRGNASITQGNTDFVAYKQASTLRRATDAALLALNNTGSVDTSKNQRRWTARIIGFTLPFALQILRHHTKNYPLLHRSITVLRDHLPAVTLAVDLCATLCLAYYSTPIFGICMLASLTIEILKEGQLLSPKIIAIWEKVAIGITFTQAIGAPFIGEMDLLDAFFVAAELIVHVYEHYLVHNPPDPRHRLTHTNAQLLIDLREDNFEINWEHLGYNPKLGVVCPKGLDIVNAMRRLVVLVKWDRIRLDALKKRLATDDLFLRDGTFLHHHPEYKEYLNKSIETTEIIEIAKRDQLTKEWVDKEIAKTDRLAQEWFAYCANKLATQVANRKIEKGNECIHYDYLQDRLRAVLANLDRRATAKAKLEEELEGKQRYNKELLSEIQVNEFEGDLFEIALQGGNSCAAGIIEPIKSVFEKQILGKNDSPLQVNFLYKLGTLRDSWYQSFKYNLIAYVTSKFPKGIFSADDVHLDNTLHFYPDAIFRTYSETVQNDMTVEDFACDHLYQAVFAKIADYTFWPYALQSDVWYSPTAVLDKLQDAPKPMKVFNKETQTEETQYSIETPEERTNLADVTAWLQNWVEAQVKIDSERERLIDELSSGTLFGKPIIVEHPASTAQRPLYIVHRDLLKLMLVDMGILKVKGSVRALLDENIKQLLDSGDVAE